MDGGAEARLRGGRTGSRSATPLEIPLEQAYELNVNQLLEVDRQRRWSASGRGDRVIATVPSSLRKSAKVVRIKNAGPFEITLDVVFKAKEDFEAIRKSGVIEADMHAARQHVPLQEMCVPWNAT